MPCLAKAYQMQAALHSINLASTASQVDRLNSALFVVNVVDLGLDPGLQGLVDLLLLQGRLQGAGLGQPFVPHDVHAGSQLLQLLLFCTHSRTEAGCQQRMWQGHQQRTTGLWVP